MKKSFFALMGAIAVLGLAACNNNEKPVESTKNPETVIPTPNPTPNPTPEPTPEPTVDNTPVATGKVIDYLPKSPTCAVTATLDLKAATEVTITTGEYTLVPEVDYELVDGELKIYGTVFEQQHLGLGSHKFEFVTEFGKTELSFNVVSNPEGTTIPTKTITGIDMSAVEAYKPTEPIAGAPDLLMTEIIHGAGEYSYVEVFNNTAEEYNLKGHRIILGYADSEDKTSLLRTDGIVENPVLGSCSAYIYQDYKIPALSSALVWLVASTPWKTATASEEEKAMGLTHVIKLDADYENHMFGTNENNLSVEHFKETLKLAPETLVFPVRPQKSLMNGTNKLDAASGMGGILTKTSGFTGISASVKRIMQIQKIDSETHYNTLMEGAPEGATYYKYEMGVVNKEEEIFNNGVYDVTKVKAYGGRQCVNGLFMRQVFYDANDKFVGYVKEGKYGIDLYSTYTPNDKKPGQIANGKIVRDTAKEAYKPIVSAFIYPNIGLNDKGENAPVKWADMVSCEYTIPTNGSKIMRFIPREDNLDYKLAFADGTPFQDLLLAGISKTNTDVAIKEIVVPVDPGYNTDYVSAHTATPGLTGWFNFKDQK